MSKEQYSAEKTVDKFLRDLNNEIKIKEYEFIDSEENSLLISLRGGEIHWEKTKRCAYKL